MSNEVESLLSYLQGGGSIEGNAVLSYIIPIVLYVDIRLVV